MKVLAKEFLYLGAFFSSPELFNTASMIELSVTVYFISAAISALIAGMYSDFFGRRITILLTTPLFIIGSVVCIFSNSIFFLLAGRILQGIGVGGMFAGAPAMMADSFEGKSLAKASSYLSTAYSLVPICAPVIGGIIQTYFGWQANFIFLGAFATLVYLFLYIKLPETNANVGKHKLSIARIYKNYTAVILNPKFILNVFALIFTWRAIPVFNVMGPFMLESKLGFTAKGYGSLALLVGLGLFLGNIINNKLLNYIDSKKVKSIGLTILVLSSIVLVLFPYLHIDNAYSLMIPIFILMLGGGLRFPNMFASTIGSVPEHGGVAGALISFLALAGAFVITGVISFLSIETILDFGWVILILSCLATLMSILANRAHLSRQQ